MNRAYTSTPYYHAIPLMVARRLSLHALLMVVLSVLLLSPSAPVLADGSLGVLYVTNFGSRSNNVGVYTIKENGELQQQQDPVPAGKGPSAITVSPDKRVAYVVNALGDEITSYDIDGLGNLTKRPASGWGGISWTISDPLPARSIVVHPSGHMLIIPEYMTANGTCIPGPCAPPDSWLGFFELDGKGYLLPEIMIKSDQIPISVAVTPDGRNLYAATRGESLVCIYNLNETTGHETAIPGCLAAGGSYPESVKVDSTGRYAYVVNSGGGYEPSKLAAFKIMPSGRLQLITTVPAGQYAVDMAFDPSGTFAAVVDYTGSALLLYKVGSDGTPIPQGSVPTGTHPSAVAFAPSGFVYTANAGSNSLSRYAFNYATGKAILLGTTATGSAPASIAIVDFSPPAPPQGPVSHDFDGDGRSDILWRHTSGAVVLWSMNGTTISGGASLGSVSTDWTIAGVGDFNGDSKADILWRHTSGAVVLWSMNGTTISGGASLGSVSTDWTIAGVGDFNGDGKADILWRHTSGAVVLWFMNGTTISGGASLGSVSTDWTIAGVGDFNGDGKADILWRHTSGAVVLWFMNGTTISGGGSLGTLSTDWTVAEVGDFNGDGKADILWRHTSGAVVLWFMNGTTISGGGSLGTLSTDWTVAEVGDFNGDGKADILWRHTSGAVVLWFMNGTTISGGGSLGTLSADWQTQ